MRWLCCPAQRLGTPGNRHGSPAVSVAAPRRWHFARLAAGTNLRRYGQKGGRREGQQRRTKHTRGAGCVGRPHLARSRVSQGVEKSVAGAATWQAGGGASRSGAKAEGVHQAGAALLTNIATAVAKAAAVVVQRREVINAAWWLGLRRLRLAAEAEGTLGGAHARRGAEYIVRLALLRKWRALISLDGRHVPTSGC